MIDPEGDFVTLAEQFGHVVIEAERSEAELQRDRPAGAPAPGLRSFSILESLDVEEQMRATAAFLDGLFDADRDFWYPVLVVVDEAQLFAPVDGGEVTDEARHLSLGAMTNLMCRGRKRGLAGVIATQRLAKLAKNVAAEASNFLMGRTFLDIDMARAADLLGIDRRQAEMFRDLPRGSFIALGPALSRRPLKVMIGGVETSARSSSPKLVPLPDALDDAADLIFTPDISELSRPVPRRAQPPAPRPTSDILAELSRPRPENPEPPQGRPVVAAVSDSEREAMIGMALGEVLSDPASAFRPDGELYQDFLVRCRIRRIPGSPLLLSAFRRRMAVIRSSVDDETASGDAWGKVLTLLDGVMEDMQGVFLLMAQAAIRQHPCPPDATIARIYGTHSVRRARRLISYFEEQGLIVLHADIKGNRIAAFPDLGVETMPGDANAPDTGLQTQSAAE